MELFHARPDGLLWNCKQYNMDVKYFCSLMWNFRENMSTIVFKKKLLGRIVNIH